MRMSRNVEPHDPDVEVQQRIGPRENLPCQGGHNLVACPGESTRKDPVEIGAIRFIGDIARLESQGRWIGDRHYHQCPA